MSAYVRKTLSFLIVLTMVLALVLVPSPIQVKSEAASVPSTLANYIQDGCTLQCWNWSLANIKANLGLIASQGYSAIQISPMQEQKETSVNKPFENWWVVYQPVSFKINEKPGNAIGTRDELIDLCAEAHKYDIKVIMDVVSNHMANNGENQLSPLIDPDILNDPSCWHDYSKNSWDYSDRYNITQYCMAGLPDLNTGSDKIQTKVLNLLKDYIDCGVDGFRFDAAKQIETPSDRSDFASDFWPTVINGANQYASSTRGIYLYSYGELLENPDNGGQLPISAYTQYMSVTDSVWSNDVRYRLEDKNASGLQQAYFKNANADKLVLWAESHDTFGDGSSVNSHPYQLFQAWALVASRAYAMSLYFPRANDMLYQEMGQIAKAGWSDANVKAVNRFHNQFIGQSEYLTKDSSGNMYYNERGNSGVMIVNFSGGGRDINIPVYAMANGTYYDQITGNKFTVNGGRLYGTMGDTGVACVYNPTSVSCSHSSHGLDGYCYDCYAYVGHSSGSKCSVCGTASTRTIYFKNSDGWSNVYLYGWHDNNSTVTSSWPGNKMTKVEGTTDIYSIDVPATATNIIFNNNGSVQTANLVPSADNNTYDYASGFWSNYGVVDNTCDYYLFGSINGEDYNDYGYKFVDGELTVTFDSTSYVYILDSNGVEYMTNDWVGEVTSATLYNVASLTAPNKLMIPGGVEVTLSVTPNADGTLTLSYSTAGCSHNWGTGSVTTAATCENAGVRTYTCSGCGKTKTEEIAALGHNYVNGICSNCGAEEVKNAMTIYFQNNWKWSSVSLYYWGSSISACADWPGNAMKLYGNDGTYDIYALEIPADVTGIVINGVKNDGSGERDKTPDITSGWYDGICYYMTWNDGNQTGSESIDKILPCEHTYTAVTTEASCTAPGKTVFTCSKCGDSYTQTIPQTGHMYGGWYVKTAATCTTDGEEVRGCSTCDLVESRIIEATGHSFSGGKCTVCGESDGVCVHSYSSKVTTAATCLGVGVKTFTCSKCGDSYTEEIPANGHSYKETVVAPTCENNGYTIHACQNCSYSYNDTPVNPIGHAYSSVVTAPTCTEKGYTTYTCANCGNVYTWNETPAAGHSYVGGKCSTCGEVEVKNTMTIYFQNNWKWSSVSLYYWGSSISACADWPGNAMELYGNDGTYDIYALEIPADVTGIVINGVKNDGSGERDKTPDITSGWYDGICYYMTWNDGNQTGSEDIEVILPCEHSYTSKVTTAASCGKEGVKTYTCSKCGDSYTESIPALEHSYANGTCTNCGAADPDYVVDLDYYLFGYINGANYGCEEDLENLGEYKFVDGKLTVKFSQESYVAVKTSDNASFYMTNGYVGSATTATLYKFTDPNAVSANKLLVSGGQTVTFTLVENWDGNLILSYTVDSSDCVHTSHNTEGVCSTCGATVEHSYSLGVCTVCGAQDPDYVVYDYYLFGYINGANYGCEEDASNLGEYLFVDGKLTVTFNADSYVGIKVVNPGAKFGPEVVGWFMTDGYLGEVTSAILYNNTTLTAADKLFVPGGVTVNFTLVTNEDNTLTLSYTTDSCPHNYGEGVITTEATCTSDGVKTFTCSKCGDSYTESIPALEHNYVDGTCTNCGDKLPVEVVKPTFEVTGTSLSFEDEILYNIYFSVTNPENIVEMGLVTFAEKLSDGTIDNAIDVIPGYVTDGTEYMVQSQGIAAKNMGDALWFKVYAKLSDGSYAYSNVAGYHAVLYAKNMLGKASTSEKMKALIVAMLNYGTEAQLYFGYKTDELMNSFLTAEQKALVDSYDESMVAAVVSANSAQTAAFPKTSGTFGVSTSVSFDGAFSVNYYFTAKKSVDNGMKLYYWDASVYNSGVALTKENATKVTEMVANGSEYWAQVSGIAAKEIDQTIYVAAVYESEGVEYTSGVTAYSLGHYCKTTAAKETSAMKDFAKATAVYGYYAKAYFANT